MPITVSYSPGIAFKSEFLTLEENGTPSDLEGTTLRMHVRSNLKSNVVLAIASTENGKIIFKEIAATYAEQIVTGIGFEVRLEKEDTLAIYRGGGKAIADVEITYPDGTIYPEIIEIVFSPNLSITRDFDV